MDVNHIFVDFVVDFSDCGHHHKNVVDVHKNVVGECLADCNYLMERKLSSIFKHIDCLIICDSCVVGR